MKTKEVGRQITLDTISILTLPLEVREVESTIPCGLRMPWLEGSNKGKDFTMASGAGCGNSFLMFHYGDRNFCVNMATFTKQLIDQIDP